MDANLLLADLARLPWALPHDIQVVVEDYEEDEEALLPLDLRLMRQLPPIHGPEFALPIRDQVPVLSERLQSYVNKAEDSRHWPEYEGMDYVGVQENDEEEWNFSDQQLEVEPEGNVEDDEIKEDKEASQQGLIVVSFAMKRPDPVVNNDMLLQVINPLAPHIATMSLEEEQPMPDVTPVFGPSLEPAGPTSVTSEPYLKKIVPSPIDG